MSHSDQEREMPYKGSPLETIENLRRELANLRSRHAAEMALLVKRAAKLSECFRCDNGEAGTGSHVCDRQRILSLSPDPNAPPKLIPQSEADAMVAAAYEAAANCADEPELFRIARAIRALISEPAAKALAEREKALIDKRDQEWINAIGAEDLEPRRPVNIKNLVAWFCDSCMSGPLGDIKKLEADNAALRAGIQQIESDDRLVQAETNKIIEKYEEDLAALKSQIASAERRGRLEEAKWWDVYIDEHIQKYGTTWRRTRGKKRVAALESAQSPQPEREGE